MIQSTVTAEIVTIGDEILIGQIENTNASWLARQMNLNGYSVVHMNTTADESDAIKNALDLALGRTDIVLITGGLGPTKDDITKKALAEYFDSQLVLDKEMLKKVTGFFASRGIALSETNKRQAEIPDRCEPVINDHGTAPGMLFRKGNKVVVSMPGVPLEMKNMMMMKVLPRLKAIFHGQQIVHKTVMTHGMGESHLSDTIHEWEGSLPGHIRLAYLPRPGIVRMRLSAAGDDRALLEKEINSELQKLRQLIPDLIFGYDDQSMEEVVGVMLRQKKMTVATAESCTGGAIAAGITSVPGSSDYFKGGIVAYENDIKQRLLDVSPEDIEAYGAVSKTVVEQMAIGAKKHLKTDFALATSGIAGPDGGTPEKPVGTVWIALASESGVVSEKFLFGNNRQRNTQRSVLGAINMLRKHLLDIIRKENP